MAWDDLFFSNDFFNNMLYPNVTRRTSASKSCPSCGLTLAEFNKTGKFGCDTCYEAFKDEIKPMIQRIQGYSNYEGRIPNRGQGLAKVKHQIKLLKQELVNAVKAENFEKAASLRDQIRSLEHTIDTEKGV